MRFLTPSGPYGVGAVMQELVDNERPSHLKSDAPGRRLLVKTWYPAAAAAAPHDYELLWEQLRDDRHTPRVVRFVLACSRHRTSTARRAAFHPSAAATSVVLYNHGLISFASENTSLMEELASHGQTVVSIQHAEQLPELKAFGAAQSQEKKESDALITRRLRDASRTEKPKLALEYYRASSDTNRIVVERATDTSFVLDRLEQVLAPIPGRSRSSQTPAAHLVGFSVGGAVSTETAKRDARALSVTNLDGGLQGTWDATALRVPYLMMYSAGNDGINDELLPSAATRLAPVETAHLNYHDVAAIMPLLRHARVTGRTNPRSFLSERNRLVREFIAAR